MTDPRSKFDVVIFDEASQVLPEDAIPSIIRGTRVVIAGDKHQLPPTTFFAGTGDSDDDEEDDGTSQDNSRNVESILDLMSIHVRPQSLEWHYRSLDERLIAFSNKEFYGNSLITFPSREEPPPAMQHYLVEEEKRDGDEDSNSAEVLRVVELVLDHASIVRARASASSRWGSSTPRGSRRRFVKRAASGPISTRSSAIKASERSSVRISSACRATSGTRSS